MRAIVIEQFGGPEVLSLKEVPTPVPAMDEALIKVRAFGINRAETYMRRGVWGEVSRISGIECVGEIVRDSTGRLAPATTVAAIMGGMGRTRNGSYAEYVTVPVSNIIQLKSTLAWSELAALPESYVTAWSCLFDNLRLQSGQTLLVRGATSALGQAAVNIASELGAHVIGVTRSPEKQTLLRSIGASEVLHEREHLSKEIRATYPAGIHAVLDLLGNTTFQDSLRMLRKGGGVCVAGFLGGSSAVPFDVLTGFPPGVNLSFFASFLLGTPDYPLARIPLQDMVNRVERDLYKSSPVAVLPFESLSDAHRLMESNQANGKIVVTVE